MKVSLFDVVSKLRRCFGSGSDNVKENEFTSGKRDILNDKKIRIKNREDDNNIIGTILS